MKCKSSLLTVFKWVATHFVKALQISRDEIFKGPLQKGVYEVTV